MTQPLKLDLEAIITLLNEQREKAISERDEALATIERFRALLATWRSPEVRRLQVPGWADELEACLEEKK